jgi:hypothetical protein
VYFHDRPSLVSIRLVVEVDYPRSVASDAHAEAALGIFAPAPERSTISSARSGSFAAAIPPSLFGLYPKKPTTVSSLSMKLSLSSANAATIAGVMTASTIAYSLIVCPSDRFNAKTARMQHLLVGGPHAQFCVLQGLSSGECDRHIPR